MKYLTAEQILFIHARVVAETGGSGGIRDLNMLLSALGRPRASFDGKDLYPDLFAKAAALMESLINNHPFIDGNKRVGIAAAALFLRINGQQLQVSNAELERFTLKVAQSRRSLEEIAEWLRSNSQPVSGT